MPSPDGIAAVHRGCRARRAADCSPGSRGRQVLGRHRTHRHHHGAVQPPRRPALTVGHVHRDVAALLDVAHRDARRGQRPLEGEAAPDQERHQVVPPVRDARPSARPPVRRAPTPGSAAGRCAGRRPSASTVVQEPASVTSRTGTGLRVALAEQQHVVRPVGGHRDRGWPGCGPRRLRRWGPSGPNGSGSRLRPGSTRARACGPTSGRGRRSFLYVFTASSFPRVSGRPSRARAARP